MGIGIRKKPMKEMLIKHCRSHQPRRRDEGKKRRRAGLPKNEQSVEETAIRARAEITEESYGIKEDSASSQTTKYGNLVGGKSEEPAATDGMFWRSNSAYSWGDYNILLRRRTGGGEKDGVPKSGREKKIEILLRRREG